MKVICGVNQESEKADYRMGENIVVTNHLSYKKLMSITCKELSSANNNNEK